MELTAVFMQAPEGYIGFVEEIPGANTQISFPVTEALATRPGPAH
jgi:hypothetical protein